MDTITGTIVGGSCPSGCVSNQILESHLALSHPLTHGNKENFQLNDMNSPPCVDLRPHDDIHLKDVCVGENAMDAEDQENQIKKVPTFNDVIGSAYDELQRTHRNVFLVKKHLKGLEEVETKMTSRFNQALFLQALAKNRKIPPSSKIDVLDNWKELAKNLLN